MYTKLVTRLIIKVLFLGIFIVFHATISQAQLQYNFERINTDNGLPTNAIKGLQFDEKTRFLWVATESGIVRYNGHGFQNFGDNDANAALNGRIVFFVKAYKGNLFGKLIDGTVFTIQRNKAVLDTRIKDLLGEFEFLEYKYKGALSNKKRPAIQIEHTDFVFQKNVYAIIGEKLFLYNSVFDSLFDFPSKINPFMLKGKPFFLGEYGDIFYTIIDYKKVIVKNKSRLVDLLGFKNKNAKSWVYQNHPNEPVYVIVENSLFKVDLVGDQLSFKLITDKIPANEFIKYVQVDPITSNIYFGTDNRGLIIAKPKYFDRILPEKNINGVSTSAYAQILLKKDIIQINTGQLFGKNTHTVNSVFNQVANTATYITKDSILLMTNSIGIIEYDLRKDKVISISNDIYVNRNNFIQIGNIVYSFNEAGVARQISYGKWEYLLKFKSAPFNFIVYSLQKLNDKEILVATTDGLYKYNFVENRFKLYFRDKNKANFRAIYDLNGYFLLGTYGGGIYMYRNDSIRKLPLDQNKYLSFTHCFIQDYQQRIWASTNKGLFMSPAQSLIDFWHKGPGNIKFSYFGKSDGIDQLELNGGCSPCAIQLSDGRFSFPGIDGLIQFNPNNIVSNYIQPQIYIDKLLVDEKIIDGRLSNIELPSKTKNLEIQLGISGMLSEENIMLEYKFDNEPFIRTNVKNSNLKFGNLSSGDHKISVRLRNTIQGKWLLVEYPFYIQYPWTLNPYMYIVYLVFIVCLILLYIRFKTIIYQRRQKVLEKEVNIKTESLNKLNDYLLKRNQAKDHVIAIMNHDILTPLKYMHITAKNLAESNNQDQIKSSIKKIASTSKELEYLTSNMLNWVKFDNIERLPNKQNFDLSVLVNDLIEFVQPFNQNKHIEIVQDVPTDTNISNWPDSLRVLLYNLLVNAIKATNKGKVIIGFRKIQNGYIVYVKDTGVGMSTSMIDFLLKGKHIDELKHHPKSKTGNGVGFQIIRNIVQLMNAQIEIESVEYQGTTINVIFMS